MLTFAKGNDTTQKEDRTPFLTLLAELRFLIYEFALVNKEYHIALKSTYLPSEIEHRYVSQIVQLRVPGANLLRVNVQIYEEACPVLYSQNEFSMHSINSLHTFAK